LAFLFTRDYEPPDWASSLAGMFCQKSEITIRKANRRNLEADLLLMNRMYNECWTHNWGFVPMTDEEIKESAKPMYHFLDPDVAFFICHEDEPVGFCLILPDLNPLLKRFNGRLGLSALIKKYLYWSEIKGLRGLLFGVKEQYRQMGLPLVALGHLMRTLRKKDQYHYLELGWNLEDNHAINRLYEDFGAKPYKRYRIYRKDL
jgi:GNAT superfamily N-acetyltransferase